MSALKQQSDYVPTMLSVTELQEHLGIGRDEAYRLVKRKDFPSMKLGGKYKIFADRLKDWVLKQQKNK